MNPPPDFHHLPQGVNIAILLRRAAPHLELLITVAEHLPLIQQALPHLDELRQLTPLIKRWLQVREDLQYAGQASMRARFGMRRSVLDPLISEFGHDYGWWGSFDVGMDYEPQPCLHCLPAPDRNPPLTTPAQPLDVPAPALAQQAPTVSPQPVPAHTSATTELPAPSREEVIKQAQKELQLLHANLRGNWKERCNYLQLLITLYSGRNVRSTRLVRLLNGTLARMDGKEFYEIGIDSLFDIVRAARQLNGAGLVPAPPALHSFSNLQQQEQQAARHVRRGKIARKLELLEEDLKVLCEQHGSIDHVVTLLGLDDIADIRRPLMKVIRGTMRKQLLKEEYCGFSLERTERVLAATQVLLGTPSVTPLASD